MLFYYFWSIIAPVIYVICPFYYVVSFSFFSTKPKFLLTSISVNSFYLNSNCLTYTQFSPIIQKSKRVKSALNGAKVVLREVDKNIVNNTTYSPGRLKIAAERYIVPGDYVVNEEYGIGRYLGIRYVHISPANVKPSHSYAERMKKSVPMVVVQFDDAEVSWFQKFAGYNILVSPC